MPRDEKEVDECPACLRPSGPVRKCPTDGSWCNCCDDCYDQCADSESDDE